MLLRIPKTDSGRVSLITSDSTYNWDGISQSDLKMLLQDVKKRIKIDYKNKPFAEYEIVQIGTEKYEPVKLQWGYSREIKKQIITSNITPIPTTKDIDETQRDTLFSPRGCRIPFAMNPHTKASNKKLGKLLSNFFE